MDPVVEFLTTIRTAHVRALFALGRTVLAEHGDVAVELLAETDELTVFGGSLRFDAVAAGPKFFDLEVEPVPGLPVGFGYEHDGAQVAFGQFSWNRCTVQARGIGDAWPAALRTWIAGAMDLADDGARRARRLGRRVRRLDPAVR